MDFEAITAQIDALNTRVGELLTKAEGDPSQIEEVKALIESDIKPQLATLTAERQEVLREEEMKSLKGTITTLEGAIADLRKPPAGLFPTVGDDPTVVDDSDPYGYVEGKSMTGSFEFKPTKGRSMFADIKRANKGNQDAVKRLTEGFEGLNEDGKALTAIAEGVSSGFGVGGASNTGGFLVRPQVERQIVLARELDNVLRPLCSKINVTTNAISLDQLTISTVAGWVAELAEKPSGGSMALASVTANVFTAAGLAVLSNQLLADSNPGIDQLAIQDIAKRLVALEETAFLNGTGTGQPLGILNTPGISTTAYTDATGTANELVDVILDAIAAVEAAHGSPSGILMHPRTWTAILKAKTSAGGYILSPDSNNPDVQSQRTVFHGPQKTLWGYPVFTTNRMPTNLGGGTNESRVIVGDFREALILDRQGITVDESQHFLFTSNATVFRAEERVGFTAARTPTAFTVVGGTGLANL